MMRLPLVVMFAAGCATGQAPAHWSYAGDTGPADWGKVASACADGKRQSPIDLTGAVGNPSAGLYLAYQVGPAKLVHNGHTIQVQPENGGSITFQGETWTLQQLHFHHPSEHTIDGQRFPMEAHFVHQGAHGQVVLAVMLVEGGGGAPFDAIFQALPHDEGEETTVAAIDPGALLPLDRRFFTYPGSLTTPPCSETVTWVVLQAPMTISRAQLDDFAALFPENARPVQPLNGRVIEKR
jgi:carbonic anhydrase